MSVILAMASICYMFMSVYYVCLCVLKTIIAKHLRRLQSWNLKYTEISLFAFPVFSVCTVFCDVFFYIRGKIISSNIEILYYRKSDILV